LETVREHHFLYPKLRSAELKVKNDLAMTDAELRMEAKRLRARLEAPPILFFRTAFEPREESPRQELRRPLPGIADINQARQC
jgi:hypothetical protein